MKYALLLITTFAGSIFAQNAASKDPSALVAPPPLSKMLPGVTAAASRPVKVESMQDEINFWSQQFVDHTRYLEAAFKKMAPNISNKAAKLREKLMRFRNDLKTTRSLGKDGNQEYRTMVKDLISLKKDALDSLSAAPKGMRVNLLKALVKHMIEEGDYHMQNLEGVKRSAAQERGFWARHDKEVAELNTLKPVSGREESKIIDQLMKMGLKDHEVREDSYALSKISRRRTAEKPVATRRGVREDQGQRADLPGRQERAEMQR